MKQTRKEQKEATRKHLVEAAYKTYSSFGFSIAAKEIAECAGVSQGTVFAHFPTVQILIDDVVADFSLKLTSRLHELAEEQGTIAGFLSAHIDVLSEYELFYMRLVEEQAKLPAAARSTFLCMQSAVSHHLGILLQSDARVKEIPQFMIFNCWMGLLHYYLLNRRMFSSELDGSVLRKHKAVLVDSFMKMIT